MHIDYSVLFDIAEEKIIKLVEYRGPGLMFIDPIFFSLHPFILFLVLIHKMNGSNKGMLCGYGLPRVKKKKKKRKKMKA